LTLRRAHPEPVRPPATRNRREPAVGKHDLAVAAVEHAGLEQGLHVAVHRFHVAPRAPRDLADRQRPGSGHQAEDVPALGRQHSPQQLDRGKADMGSLRLAGEGALCPRSRFLGRGNTYGQRAYWKDHLSRFND